MVLQRIVEFSLGLLVIAMIANYIPSPENESV